MPPMILYRVSQSSCTRLIASTNLQKGNKQQATGYITQTRIATFDALKFASMSREFNYV